MSRDFKLNEDYYKNSMQYWWPKIKDIPGIPMPKTIMVKSKDEWWWSVLDGDNLPTVHTYELNEAADELGYPVFVRSSFLSAKHQWRNTCYVDSPETLLTNLCRLAEEGYCRIPYIPADAFFFREYIQMASEFTAFYNDMPIAPEQRYFVKDGQVQCRHFYWPEESIHHPSIRDWGEALAKMSILHPQENEVLSLMAERVGLRLGGLWSVDFCKADDGTWYLIDCALAINSYHPENCKFAHISHL